jgi:hypothetical protein
MSLEKVQGAYQGACYPFRRGLQSGIVRVEWGADGALWCGLTNRGWGSKGDREHGLQRLVWRGETPFELQEVRARPEGFELEFTTAFAGDSFAPESIEVRSWTYDHHEAYGCPERDVRTHVVQAIGAASTDRHLRVAVEGLEDCRVYEVKVVGVKARGDGAAPLYGIGWYTRNRSPR